MGHFAVSELAVGSGTDPAAGTVAAGCSELAYGKAGDAGGSAGRRVNTLVLKIRAVVIRLRCLGGRKGSRIGRWLQSVAVMDGWV